MIRAILRVAEWLDKRFPPKVTVTDEIFAALQEKEHRHSKEIATISGEVMVLKGELRSAEKSIIALKEFISKGGDTSISEANRRAQFISEGRMSDPAAMGGA